MSDDKIHAAIAGSFGCVGAHARFKLAIAADGDASLVSHFRERAIAIVVEEKIRHVVVGDENVLPAVVVVIKGDYAQAVAALSAQRRMTCSHR